LMLGVVAGGGGVFLVCLFACGVGLFLICYWSISVAPVRGALTFFAAAKKDKQRKRLKPPILSGSRSLLGVVVHLESVFSHIRR
jgi:hypothetical protein